MIFDHASSARCSLSASWVVDDARLLFLELVGLFADVLRMTRVAHSEGKVVVPYNDPRNYGRRRQIRMAFDRARHKFRGSC